MAIFLKGTVKMELGTPIESASVRLIGSDEPLGNVRSAAVRRPGAVSWTRTMTGFSGSLWNCWQKFVMNQVAGITWGEFKDQVVEHNPALIADGYVFKADRGYKLPEQVTEQPIVAWTRTITRFSGNRRDCWKAFVQGKVEGITWAEFKDQVVEHNPALREDDYFFEADKTYVLPENVLGPTEITWTHQLTGFSGNRWQCWEAHVRDQVQGITWAEFMQAVVERNPTLRDDGYVFKADKTYVLPENRTRPLYYLFTLTDKAGRYAFEELTTPGDYELVVQALGYHPYRKRLALQADTVHDVALTLLGPRMISDWPGYATAPVKVRKLINQALSMLGDDPAVFDSLSPDLQKLATGFFHPDPSDLHHKDIVCADLVTICLAAAGVDYHWQVTEPPGTPYNTTHAANYYRPSPSNPKIREVAENEEWLPGDIIIYGNEDLATNRIRHVNLYIGPFNGTDLSGNPHPQSKGYDVVNASLDFEEGGTEVGTAIRPVTLESCRTQRFGYQWFRRVRVLELEREFHLDMETRGFIQLGSDEFKLDGQPFRFIGVNIRGLVHYGGDDLDILKYSRPEHRDDQLNAAREMRARVVRVFLGNSHRTTQQIGDRLEETLTLAERYELYLIVAFTDFYANTGLNPQGDEKFYEGKPYTTLNKDFFTSGYQENYLPFVEEIVSRFHDHKRIFAWELGNELKAWEAIDGHDHLRPELFIQFAATVSRRIRQLDPIHLITTGIISTRVLGCNDEQGERLYRLASLDFLTIHNYYKSPECLPAEGIEEDDSFLAQKVDKPFIIEEAGFKGSDRTGCIRQDLEKWFGRKARGYMQWGFMATDFDMGDGDGEFGMDHGTIKHPSDPPAGYIHHPDDWDDLFKTYKDWDPFWLG